MFEGMKISENSGCCSPTANRPKLNFGPNGIIAMHNNNKNHKIF